jgi:hypothetical protein
MSWVCFLVAGFQVTISGRFWVITEDFGTPGMMALYLIQG